MNILKKATLMLCCAAFAGAAEALAQDAIGQTHILIAHRGGKYEGDENTIDGFSKAYAAGVRAYETDFRMIAEYIQSNPRLWHKDCFYEEPPHEP